MGNGIELYLENNAIATIDLLFMRPVYSGIKACVLNLYSLNDQEVENMSVKVNVDKCDGCGACVEVCPNESITLNEVAHINEEECVECETCIDECPNDAITME
jgi:NAD-dependent dihydropyrimidine dehydrogenase PreA subunit